MLARIERQRRDRITYYDKSRKNIKPRPCLFVQSGLRSRFSGLIPPSLVGAWELSRRGLVRQFVTKSAKYQRQWYSSRQTIRLPFVTGWNAII